MLSFTKKGRRDNKEGLFATWNQWRIGGDKNQEQSFGGNDDKNGKPEMKVEFDSDEINKALS